MQDANAETLARQEPLKLQLPASVAVVGCGGVGSWVAYILALAGVKELWLFDHDTVSEHNRNRLPVPPCAVGRHKAEAVRQLILTVRPECMVYACGGFSAELANNLNLQVPWIVATTDTHASRQMVSAWAATNGISYVEAAAEGEYGSVTGIPAEWATAEEAMPGYASVPVWVGSAVLAATVACYYILHDTALADNSFRMGWSAAGHFDYNEHSTRQEQDNGI